jgi:hypothetical protein
MVIIQDIMSRDTRQVLFDQKTAGLGRPCASQSIYVIFYLTNSYPYDTLFFAVIRCQNRVRQIEHSWLCVGLRDAPKRPKEARNKLCKVRFSRNEPGMSFRMSEISKNDLGFLKKSILEEQIQKLA